MSSCCCATKIHLLWPGTDQKKGNKTISYSWYDLIGNVGVILVLAAYLLLQLERISATRPPYLIASGPGASLILISLLTDFSLSAFVIEAAWLLISVYGLMRRLRGPSEESAP